MPGFRSWGSPWMVSGRASIFSLSSCKSCGMTPGSLLRLYGVHRMWFVFSGQLLPFGLFIRVAVRGFSSGLSATGGYGVPFTCHFFAHCVPRYTRGPSSRGHRIVFATTLRFLSVAMHCFWVSSCAFPTLSTGVFLLGMSAILADLRSCRVGGRMPIRFGGSSGSRASGPLPGGFGLGFVKAACIALSGVTLLSAECFLQPV